MSTKIPLITTADQLLAASKDLDPCELVRGELIMMSPAGYRHARIEARIVTTLTIFVEANNLGAITAGDGGYWLERDPDTVRAPDVAFVRAERMQDDQEGFYPGPPDLAIEIRSPDDRPKEISAKIEDCLRLGVHTVWDVQPRTRTVTVYRRGAEPEILSEADSISEPVLLPGFKVVVGSLFP